MIHLPNFESGKMHLSNNFSLRNHNPVSFKSCFLSAELHLQLGNITAQPRVFSCCRKQELPTTFSSQPSVSLLGVKY